MWGTNPFVSRSGNNSISALLLSAPPQIWLRPSQVNCALFTLSFMAALTPSPFFSPPEKGVKDPKPCITSLWLCPLWSVWSTADQVGRDRAGWSWSTVCTSGGFCGSLAMEEGSVNKPPEAGTLDAVALCSTISVWTNWSCRWCVLHRSTDHWCVYVCVWWCDGVTVGVIGTHMCVVTCVPVWISDYECTDEQVCEYCKVLSG